ncbi:hypothetical protein NDU88_002856 [Pleurodeles waltl]|uniref:Uncharacterized protein n=1 Tax=Pleurodeles waltl TaxID=8319 RepID=A0AAV7T433_PLEWA|nr:hypothetical protein NDU88_002856 [Pleurodeles waltl]
MDILDGLPVAFYQEFLPNIQDRMVTLFNAFTADKGVTPTIAAAEIALHPSAQMGLSRTSSPGRDRGPQCSPLHTTLAFLAVVTRYPLAQGLINRVLSMHALHRYALLLVRHLPHGVNRTAGDGLTPKPLQRVERRYCSSDRKSGACRILLPQERVTALAPGCRLTFGIMAVARGKKNNTLKDKDVKKQSSKTYQTVSSETPGILPGHCPPPE